MITATACAILQYTFPFRMITADHIVLQLIKIRSSQLNNRALHDVASLNFPTYSVVGTDLISAKSMPNEPCSFFAQYIQSRCLEEKQEKRKKKPDRESKLGKQRMTKRSPMASLVITQKN